MKEKLHSCWEEKDGIQIMRYGFLISPEDVSKEIKNKKGRFIEIYGNNGTYLKVIKRLERKIIIAGNLDEFLKILQELNIKNYNENITIDVPPVFIDNENKFVKANVSFVAENDSNIIRFSKIEAITKEDAEKISKANKELK